MSENHGEPEMLRTGQARKLVGVSKNTMTRLIRENRFPNATKLGSQHRIPKSDVDAYLEANRARARKSA